MSQMVQDVEIAEALLESYLQATKDANPSTFALMTNPEATAIGIGTAGQIFPEIWRRLDAARAAASASGRDLSRYDAVRNQVGSSSEHGITSFSTLRVGHGLGRRDITTGEANHYGAQAAREAIHLFRTTFPDQAWHATNAPVPELRSGRKFALMIAIVGGVVLIAGVIALVAFQG